MGERSRKFVDSMRIPFTREGIFVTNNQFQKAGPKGFIEVKVLENGNLYVRVDLPGVPDDAIHYRVDAVRQKVVIFSGETRRDKYDDVREYSGTADLGCDCCEITGVDAKMKDGVLRMIVSRVEVKDPEKKCCLTLPPFTGRSGRHMEDHPFLVKGGKETFVGVPISKDGLYYSVDVPGACADDVDVLASDNEIRFRVEIKNVYKHDESARIYLGSINLRSPADAPAPSLIANNTLAWDAEFGVLKILVIPSTTTTTNVDNKNE